MFVRCEEHVVGLRLWLVLRQVKAQLTSQWIQIFYELTFYSRVHISSDEFFSKVLKKPSIVQKKNDASYMKAFGLFNKMKQKKYMYIFENIFEYIFEK